MNDDEKSEIYRTGYEELQNTVENQLSDQYQLNQRAIDLAKIDILAVSIVVSATSLSQQVTGVPLVLAGTGALLLSLGCCLQVYRPRDFTNGIGSGAADQIDRLVEEDGDRVEHYRNLMLAFQKMVEYSKSSYDTEVKHFRNALWSSAAAILFFAALVPRTIIRSFPPFLDYVIILLVVISLSYGRYLYNDD